MLVLLALLTAARAADRPDWMHPGRSRLQAGVNVRYGTLPDKLLDMLYQEHGTIRGVGPGLELAWVKEGFHLTFQSTPLVITTPDSVWLEKDKKPTAAEWVEIDVTYLGSSVAMGYAFPLGRWLSLQPNMGYGLNLRLGDMWAWPTEGDENTALQDRTKVEGSEGHGVALPKYLHNPNLALRANVHPHERVTVGLTLGMFAYIYGEVGTFVLF